MCARVSQGLSQIRVLIRGGGKPGFRLWSVVRLAWRVPVTANEIRGAIWTTRTDAFDEISQIMRVAVEGLATLA